MAELADGKDEGPCPAAPGCAPTEQETTAQETTGEGR